MDFGRTFDGDPDDFTRPDAGDDRLTVMFYMGTLRDDAESIAQGRPIFRDVEYCRVFVPGDRNHVIDQPATQTDRRRFARQYERFKAGQLEDQQLVGTRLSEWPLLTRGQVEELHYMQIRTVEQLAEVSDAIKLKIPGLTTLSRNAATWLGKTHIASEAAKQAKLIEDQANQIATLNAAVADLMRRAEKRAETTGEAV